MVFYFYVVSIPLEMAFSVGSTPCLQAANWRPGTAADSIGALCDPTNPEGDLVRVVQLNVKDRWDGARRRLLSIACDVLPVHTYQTCPVDGMPSAASLVC